MEWIIFWHSANWKGDDSYDYLIAVRQDIKQCEAFLTKIIKKEGYEVSERGLIDTLDDKRFPYHRNMTVFTYACMSPDLLPEEMQLY